MANKFVRRNTKVELDIEGNLFTVDFGRDGIPRIVADLHEGVKAIESQLQGVTDPVKQEEMGLEKTKALFRKAINALLEDDTASDRIFKNDDSSSFHGDVYTFLVEEYAKMVNQIKQEYSPNRAERRSRK